ncbi:MAG TPA: hypothetical protein VKU87_02490, partial [Thermomicrobiaceae bacterium]|nr:hypothetical protein [Thermomicrobiaceae bacterium]
ENGNPGVLRLIDQQLGGQAGWLLPLALIAFIVLGWQARPHLYDDRKQQALVLWGVWLLTAAIFFSVAGFFHAYYLIVLAPPIAALGGAGIATLWHDYRRGNWRGWLLPVTLIAVAYIQTRLLASYTSWSRWMTPAILALAVLAAIALIVARLVKLLNAHWSRIAGVAAIVGTVALLLAPTVWSAETTLAARGGLTPSAGPQASFGGGGGFFNARSGGDFKPPAGFNAGAGGPGGGGQVDQALINYLLKEQGSTKFLVATPSSTEAAPIILETGKAVMALGGFSGSDQILTTSQLAKLVANNTVRFFLLSGGGGFGGFGGGFGRFGSSPEGGAQSDRARPQGDNAYRRPNGAIPGFGQSASLTSWVVANCKVVPSSTWESGQSTAGTSGTNQFDRFGAGQLYDCSTAGHS